MSLEYTNYTAQTGSVSRKTLQADAILQGSHTHTHPPALIHTLANTLANTLAPTGSCTYTLSLTDVLTSTCAVGASCPPAQRKEKKLRRQ
jgi:hypothetical protein